MMPFFLKRVKRFGYTGVSTQEKEEVMGKGKTDEYGLEQNEFTACEAWIYLKKHMA